MTALYIALVLLAIIIILLLLDVGIIFELDGDFSVRFRISAFTLSFKNAVKIINKFSEKKKKKAAVTKIKKKKPARGSVKPRPPKKKKTPRDVFGFIKMLTKITAAASESLFKRIRIKLYYLSFRCAAAEAQSTAEMYAAASSAIFGLLEILDRFLHFKYNPDLVFIFPDFTSEKPEFAFKIQIVIKPIHLFSVAFSLLKAYIKRKDKPQNERNTVKASD
ncbi:hypothetical protein SDC9_89048 [bioreactor metagenome]|uniref:DUF2953 domain-containing protein n=1 Tax=bioreactor metagenome TaxID=1076179 RepID=A0A644ZUP8_9ZZZZ|nr:hypothetical protein [Oscillospiraceae bacterium]